MDPHFSNTEFKRAIVVVIEKQMDNNTHCGRYNIQIIV